MKRTLERLVALDCRLFDAVARSHTPALDRAFVTLTRSANHSKLWFAIAGGLVALGGRRGRRGGLRGVGSIAATSAFVNLGVKKLVRRPRPALRHVPAARRLRAQPLTTSFPSGHAASAAAFATGVAAELPAAALPLAPLAATVGLSRTYVGVHYPFDVVAGAGIGAAIATLSRAVWPVLPAEADEIHPTRAPLAVDPRPDGRGLTLVVNHEAGSRLSTPDLDALRERLPHARVVEVEDADRLRAALEAAARDCEVLGICGGDGSTAVAAEVALEHDLPLLLVPAGTLNHLGRDIRVESAEDAVGALERGEAIAIDLGRIDGRPFVNTASFGGYTEMLEIRNRLQTRIGRWPAHVVAVLRTAFGGNPLRVSIDGEQRTAWMVFVGNCRHEPSGFAPTWRPRMDDGALDVRVLAGDRPFARGRLLLSILSGRLSHSVAYDRRCVERLRVETAAGSLPLARDGDGFEGSGSFTVDKLRGGLVVFAPAVDGVPSDIRRDLLQTAGAGDTEP